MVIDSPLRVGLPCAGLLLALLSPVASSGGAPLYEWTDDQGITRYTTHLERVPGARRQAAAPVLQGDPAGIEAEIAELEGRIAADEAAIADWLGDSDGALGSGDLRVVSKRLPRLQAELRALRARSEAARPADGP